MALSLVRRMLVPLAQTQKAFVGSVSVLKTEAEFDEAVKSSTPTLVDFFADWCGPCKMLTPTLKDIVNESDKDINLVMVNVDDFGDLAADFDVSSIPCVKIFKSGEIVGGFVGAKEKNQVLKELETVIN